MKLHLFIDFILMHHIAHLLDMVILLLNQKHHVEATTFWVMCYFEAGEMTVLSSAS